MAFLATYDKSTYNSIIAAAFDGGLFIDKNVRIETLNELKVAAATYAMFNVNDNPLIVLNETRTKGALVEDVTTNDINKSFKTLDSI